MGPGRAVGRAGLGGAVAAALLVLAAGSVAAGPVAPPSPATLPAGPAPGAWTVVALGDSVTAGTSCGCRPFPDRYADGLRRRGAAVRVANRGDPGATSTDLLEDLATGPTAADVADADVVLVTTGANDVADVADDVLGGSCGTDLACAQDDLDRLRTDLPAVLARIRQLRDGRRTAVLVTGYWNVYEDGETAARDYSPAGRAASDQLTRVVDEAIRAATTADGATYVDLSTPFRGAAGEDDPTDLLADDGDHPDAAGHQVIADALLAAGVAPLHLPR